MVGVAGEVAVLLVGAVPAVLLPIAQLEAPRAVVVRALKIRADSEIQKTKSDSGSDAEVVLAIRERVSIRQVFC